MSHVRATTWTASNARIRRSDFVARCSLAFSSFLHRPPSRDPCPLSFRLSRASETDSASSASAIAGNHEPRGNIFLEAKERCGKNSSSTYLSERKRSAKSKTRDRAAFNRVSLLLFLSLCHTHTHTHVHEREQQMKRTTDLSFVEINTNRWD